MAAKKKKTKVKANKSKTSAKAAKKPKTKAAAKKVASKKKASSVKKAVKKVTKKKVAKKAAPKKKAVKKKVVKKVEKVKKVKAAPKKKVTASKKPVSKKQTKAADKGLIKEKEIEKVLAVEAPKEEVAPAEAEEVVLTDSEGRRYCRVKDCDQLASVDAYCRYHYLLFWKKIQIRKKILTEGKLEKYIEELTARYPDKYLDMLRKDLRSEKEFLAAIQELEIDDNNDESMDEEDSQSYIEEVRGISESSGSRSSDDDY